MIISLAPGSKNSSGFCQETEAVEAVVAVRKYSSDLGPGDTALVPTVTFVATANVACMAGAKIVFADVMPPQD
jgi:dTDP-4-amino-4,6-dideoxygalactose transaminase